MRIRSVDALEDELKTFLTNPHTSSNMKNAVSMAEKILEVKKDSNYALYTMALHEVCVANKVAPMADYTKAIENFENIIKVGSLCKIDLNCIFVYVYFPYYEEIKDDVSC